ncbi:MAG: response regulator transcription factor [Anaerolineae bacterium]|nr:response regulator transcription factor [Anaerolineae bacterium]
MSEKILIVEDNLVLQDTLKYNLAQTGYRVRAASCGAEAIRQVHSENPDLVILDIILPDFDGFEVCQLLRQESNIPILILTACRDEVDKIAGFEAGADDYMVKPFSLREFQARVRALLRRGMSAREKPDPLQTTTPTRALCFDNLMIDLNRNEAYVDGRKLPLKPKEFKLLCTLAQHRGQTLSRTQLMQMIWNRENDNNSRTVDVHIRWLRNKIEYTPDNPIRIVTVWGVGYRFDG